MNLAIETEHLGKRYGDVTAVEDLSLRVAEGEIYAFLGLNGAGKTTTIRMALGMIRPTTGSARVLQTPVRLGSREPWARVGYLVEAPRAYPELTVWENLEAARRLHPGASPAAVGRIIERLALGPYAGRRAGTLSQGNAQRLGLAKALLHEPELLLLGLTRERGVTVFMSSHILAEVARLAQRVGVIHQGRLIQEMSAKELERNRRRRLIVRARDLGAARRALAEAGHAAEPLPDGALSLNGAAVDRPDDIAAALARAGAPPTHLVVEEEELEAYFLRLVGMGN